MLTGKRVIKVKIETTKGTKVAGDQDILAFETKIEPTAPMIDRQDSGLYRGNSITGVVGELSGECSFKTELRGNGSAGLEPGLAILLQACGFKQTTQTYNMHSVIADDETISIDVFIDGKKKSLAGANGTVTFEGDVGKRMMCNFKFSGIWQAVVDAAMPAWSPSTTAPMMLRGGTFTLDTVAQYISKVGIDTGNVVVPEPDINAESGIAYYQITDYKPVISMDPPEVLVASYDFHGKWLAGTTAAVSMILDDGTDKVTFAIPKIQYRDLPEGDRDGVLTHEINGDMLHSSGNDALTITAASLA